MKVALVHDHLAQYGGAERVLQVLADIYSQAPIYTLLYDKDNATKNYPGRKIDASIIQRLPGGVKYYKWYLALMPLAVEFFDMRQYDLVISDTSSFAKGVITLPNTLHICYCHTPTRYLWSDTHEYINELKYNKFIKKIIALFLTRLRTWDRLAADRVDYFIANSKTVQKRIWKYYRRESEVMYPPVETNKFSIASQDPFLSDDQYFLIGCRLAPYKRVDLVIEAFKDLSHLKLRIFGGGIDLKRLRKIAAEATNIEFVGEINDREKAELMSNCLAFINPQEEDFGITPVEAMAAGRPIIAYRQGGATETVIEDLSGMFFEKQDKESLKNAIVFFMEKRNTWDSLKIKAWAENFSVENFKKKMAEFVEKKKGPTVLS